ncbi:MAG: alkaline phosphatase family protein [bacterium]
MKKIIAMCLIGCGLAAQGADYVIALSVDGLGSSYLQTMVDAGKAPHFKQLQAESAGTANARNDYDVSVTLPNHTSMVTSRRVKEAEGHSWTNNTDPAKGVTLHSHKGAYISSVFAVAHDHGLKTGMWATKTKFSLFPDSYNATNGAPDTTGVNNGRNKVDYSYIKSSVELVDNFINTMTNQPCQFAFVHFGECDGAGHSQGWGSEPYYAALVLLDGQLGRIMDLIATDPKLKGKTALILTADHGGAGKDHYDTTKPLDYTIPFYVWGDGVTPGDLYALNTDSRLSPGEGHPDYAAPKQPIRNGEVGNLALFLLGLPPIPGSTIDAKQDLRVSAVAK